MTTAGAEPPGSDASAEHADDAGRQHDIGEGHVQGEDGDEGGRGNGPQHAVAQGARADAPGGEHHDGGHRRLDAVEYAGHHRHVAEGQVDPGQRNQDRQRRQHEQHAGHDATPGAVHQPADVGRELLRLGARQHHGVVQRVQEAVLADPAPALDQLRVHHGNLAGGAAETDEAELEPVQQCVAEADGWRCLTRCLIRCRHDVILIMHEPASVPCRQVRRAGSAAYYRRAVCGKSWKQERVVATNG